MIDNEKRILEKWREKRGTRFLDLATAKELEKCERKFAHLAAAAEKAQRERFEEQRR